MKSTLDFRLTAVRRCAMTPSTRHEINNVLAALMAEAQLLQMESLPPDVVGGVDRVVLHTRRLRDLLRTDRSPAPELPAE